MNILFTLIAIAAVIFFIALPFIVYSFGAKINELTRKVNDLESHRDASANKTVVSKQRVQEPVLESSPQQMEPARAIKRQDAPKIKAQPDLDPAVKPQPTADPWWPGGDSSRQADYALINKLKQWLFGGNTVVRVGIIVLFFGVAFLLKFAIERNALPIEFRLMSTALGGIALLGLGWYLRNRKENYSLALQGAGIGIIYMTVYATVMLYHLMTPLWGLGLMVIMVLMASAISVLQDARSLAILSIVGGFLAPVLVSTGSANHVVLFSYYAVLDAGILFIAWHRAWRELNLIGFVFTFVIASLWGFRYYNAAHFETTEPFLIFFFFLYVAIPILYAFRQPINLKGWVDGSLVFGVPFIAFGLQSRLVGQFEYGMAFSALFTGLFYAILASTLWKSQKESYRLLVEVFLSLSVAFGTLAIPFAVDGSWTGTAWALEGAALVWVGVRQRHSIARAFGILVQLGAGISFLGAMHGPSTGMPILNSGYLSAVMVSVAGLYSAFLYYRHSQLLGDFEQQLSSWLLGWGLLWWFGAGLNEISDYAQQLDQADINLIFITLSVAVMGVIAHRYQWQQMRLPMIGLLLVMMLMTVLGFVDPHTQHLLAGMGILAWPLAYATHYVFLRKNELCFRQELVLFGHLGAFLLAIIAITWESAFYVGELLPDTTTWQYVIWGLVPALVHLANKTWGGRLTWPVQAWPEAYSRTGASILIVYIVLWSIHATLQQGAPTPLSYLPFINPLEIVILFTSLLVLQWCLQIQNKIKRQQLILAWVASAFWILNGIIGRTVHYLGDVPFNLPALWASPKYQATISIIWTVLALSIMVAATRTLQRKLWFGGSILLAVVVIKLFLVDLSEIGTVARFVSFIIVGLLIMIIGYYSPLPPKPKQETQTV